MHNEGEPRLVKQVDEMREPLCDNLVALCNAPEDVFDVLVRVPTVVNDENILSIDIEEHILFPLREILLIMFLQ